MMDKELQYRLTGASRIQEAITNKQKEVWICDQHTWYVGTTESSSRIHNSLKQCTLRKVSLS
jgi:hypothetical protein